MYIQLSLLFPHETMVRSQLPHAVGPGRAEPEPGPPSSQSASEAQLHVSAHLAAHMGEEAGSAGRSRRSLHTRRKLGAGAAVVGEGVGRGVLETRPLARPPTGTQKK